MTTVLKIASKTQSFSIFNIILSDRFNEYSQGSGLMEILRNLLKNKKEQLRILALGLDNAGKTTILKTLSNEDISTITPTQGFNIKNLTHDKFKLNVWKMAAIRQYLGNYFTNTDALVYVIDSADTKRVKQAGQQLQKLLFEKELSGVPLLIFANKQDLIQALQPDEILKQLKMGGFNTRKWTITACSATKQEGLQYGLTWLIESVKKRNSQMIGQLLQKQLIAIDYSDVPCVVYVLYIQSVIQSKRRSL